MSRDERRVSTGGEFAGRTALVTGGASGIGAATVALLRERGAQVAAFDLDPSAVPAGAMGIAGDVSDSRAVDAAIERVETELGPLDAVICCAGVGGESLHTVDVSDEEWRQVFAINTDGVFFFNRAAARVMVPRGRGRIVNVASIAGKEGNPMAAAYSASKAAVIGLTKSIGKDLATSGVLVNCIAPAVIATPILDQLSQEHVDYMVERIPMGRMGRSEEVAELIAFLASDRMSFSTGATFDVSGGRAVF
jgi:2-dehydro-3-deoxy-L-rhamnonate dehydrogenase (NAD+)